MDARWDRLVSAPLAREESSPPAPPVAPPPGSAVAEPGLVGFLVGTAVPALVASGAWWVGAPAVTTIAAAGIPIGAVLGAAAGRRLAGPDWIATAFGLGILAPLVPGALIGALFLAGAVGSTAESGAPGLVGSLLLACIALGAAEVIGTPITVPVALVVALLVRRAERMPRARALRHLGLLLATALAAGIVTFLVASGTIPRPDIGLAMRRG